MNPNRPLFKNEKNKKYGHWKVIKYKGKGRWLCKCACGKKKDVSGQSLREGTSTSCGCSWSRRSLEEVFWKRVNVQKSDECWLWIDKKGNKCRGYGQLMFNRKSLSAHRVCWEINFGKIPNGKCVLHDCDNPSCVNPNHLFLGTNEDNVNDKVSKNRQAKGNSVRKNHTHIRGEVVKTAKLNDEKVKIIKTMLRDGVSQNKISKIIKMSRAQINYIAKGKSWAHITI